ncbi:unnamed protein product [Sphagnum jensenii]|uniref:Uncharacterized protein n=1 Tax=Sphagnum jensenii TaxID=128206 RepID=A0ABP1A2N9_9BRYO
MAGAAPAGEKEGCVIEIGHCTEERDGEQDAGGAALDANSENSALLSRERRDPEVNRLVQPRDGAAGELSERNRAESETVQVNPIEIEAERLLEIDDDPKLKRVLKEWEKLFKVESLSVEKITARAIVVKNELYQLVGFYSVFQGVVLTAVAQTNLIKCNQSWGPASLSLLASIATLAGVCNKLNSYNKVKRSLKKATTDLKVRVFYLLSRAN